MHQADNAMKNSGISNVRFIIYKDDIFTYDKAFP